MNTSIANDFLHLANTLQKEGYNMDQITLQLREKGAPDNLLQEAVQHLKQLHINRKRSTGFACCGIGVALLVVGCMITGQFQLDLLNGIKRVLLQKFIHPVLTKEMSLVEG